MVLIFLAIAASLLSIAIIYATHVESKRIDAIERETRALLTDMKETKHKISWLQERYEVHIKQIADLLEIVGALKKEFEVMLVRQRSLEKRIIEANRTVHLVFGKPIPMQVENIPHQVVREKKGRGKAALIHV